MPVRSWMPHHFDVAVRHQLLVLYGLGDEDAEHQERGDVAVHMRRAMTVEEEAGLAHIRAARTAR